MRQDVEQIVHGLDLKIQLKTSSKFKRTDLAKTLDRNLIGNRMLFGGNLVRQPAFVELRKRGEKGCRIATKLSGSDTIMNETLFLGTYPGLTRRMLEKEISVIKDFFYKK